MIDPIVRPARASDARELAWLESEARATLIDQRGGERWLETNSARGGDWAGHIEASDVFVAVIDDVVIGYLVLDVDENLAMVDDVYVTPDARELGFGDALLEAAIERARHRGARRLEGEALPGDRNTKNLYERASIKARLITVSTEL